MYQHSHICFDVGWEVNTLLHALFMSRELHGNYTVVSINRGDQMLVILLDIKTEYRQSRSLKVKCIAEIRFVVKTYLQMTFGLIPELPRIFYIMCDLSKALLLLWKSVAFIRIRNVNSYWVNVSEIFGNSFFYKAIYSECFPWGSK